MATNQTTNYQLNQWEPTDQVLRTDFNADNAKLDAALNALSDQVAKMADEEDLTALSESVAAVSAGMGNCDMELLTYTGNGAMGQSSPTRITFSSLPDAFLVVGDLAILLGRGGVKEAILACKDVTYSESFVSTFWHVRTSPTRRALSAVRPQPGAGHRCPCIMVWTPGTR